ncbi:hypothetical protein LCGC14_0992510 [marine sediment metagenome]|uniref:Uncharacterized protein n=1 Tax=marine sediment metagenome TaxID=412755 RepID=A0A0F9QNV8_9ZZZZ
MAKKQTLDPRDYEAAPQLDDAVEAADHKFVLVEGEEKPQPVSPITAEEQERRNLQRRFKRIFGYKPTTKDVAALRSSVETAEHRASLKRDGII